MGDYLVFSEWEDAVTRIIEEDLECTRSDAQSIVEAKPFLMSRSWALDLSPRETANKIINDN